MFNYNNDHIFTGYLKQLLTSFNLPKYRIYTKADREYAKKFGHENITIIETLPQETPTTTIANKDKVACVPYIKDGEIQEYINGTWLAGRRAKSKNSYIRIRQDYYYNMPDRNQTKTFRITNNIYDRYTHEYLGDYLRFHRDYYDIDLMPFYNCFNNNICTNLRWHSTILNSDDTQYKIYALPVKFFQNYTIAIDCNFPVELCCNFYSTRLLHEDISDDSNLNTLITSVLDKTYQKINSCSFGAPFLYTKLSDINNLIPEIGSEESRSRKESRINLIELEPMLKLFIKIPTDIESSIVVLEGNYLGFNDSVLITNSETEPSIEAKRYSWTTQRNHWVTNYEYKEAPNTFKPITSLQLLKINTGKSYPFADKLVEYLIGNTITGLDDIEDNVARVQAVLLKNNISYDITGIWEDKYRPIFYDYINQYYNTNDLNQDLLGYIDKTVEKYYSSSTDTISSIDIYPGQF